MLRSLKLVNYRSFRNFTIKFAGTTCLVGPNNAGKSTVLTALRLADGLLRVAHARRPSRREVHRGAGYFCYPISLSEFPSLRESLRYEFHNNEARLELTWTSGNKLVAIWPESSDDFDELEGFFYLQLKDKQQPSNVAVARRAFPRLGVVPILSPLEHTELRLNPEYVRKNVSSRLSSRHFRNQLWELDLDGQLADFKDFAAPWLSGIRIDRLEDHEEGDGKALDLFLSESGSRVPKEVIWAGDGIQVWLQILYHLYRLREMDVIVLDEPDVYLHADLQRRLTQLLESHDSQTIVATHSAEMVAEAPRSSVVWVEKSRTTAKVVNDEALLERLTGALGSQFNLRLAKAMRSKVVLMVEGQDMQVLRRLGKTVGASRLALEDGVTIVTLQGYARSDQVEAFKWILNDFLADAVECFVFLDRDYRPQVTISALESKLAAVGVNAHIWRRKELESYVIVPDAIARISGASPADIRGVLDREVASMESDIFSRMLDEKLRAEKAASAHAVSVTTRFKTEFDSLWKDTSWRLEVAPPKQILAAVNRWLQGNGFKAVSAMRLASSLAVDEIPAEMRGALARVDDAASKYSY